MSTHINPTVITRSMKLYKGQIGLVVRGCDGAIDVILKTLLGGGHGMLEGVPGTGKSLLAKAMSRALGIRSSVFTFMPDMMPGDVIGTEVFNPVSRQMEPLPGKIHWESRYVLGDEFNRAPPKTVNAVIEAMQDGILHIGQERKVMKRPFFVLVRNPIEQSGTYKTPEAVLDRLAAAAILNYPPFDEAVKLALDRNVVKQDPVEAAGIKQVLDPEELILFQDYVRDEVEIPMQVARYITRLVYATHPPEEDGVADDPTDSQYYDRYMPEKYKKDKIIYVGDSNRAIIWLAALAKANAVLNERNKVTDDDVKKVAISVLAHRLTLNDQRMAKYGRHIGRLIVRDLLAAVKTTD